MLPSKIPLLTLLTLVLPNLIAGEPLKLTDKTWKEMLCGQWMVEFYAPWCPSCQHFTAIWSDFAKAMGPKEVKVAAIDINEYPSLSGRFRISLLPTIYYVRDGVFRQYNGERSLNGLKNYIEFQEWQRTEPVSSYFAPDSVPMAMISSLFDISVLVRDAYNVLLEKHGWPAWLIYIVFSVIVIMIGFILGFGFLMIVDYCLAGSPKDDVDYIPDDSRDVEDLEENDPATMARPKKRSKAKSSLPSSVTSSTPQRRTTATVKTTRTQPDELQDDEALMDEVLADEQDDDDDDDSDELNTSDVQQASDDEDQPGSASVRYRGTNK